MEIITKNVNTLFSDMLWRFKTSGVKSESRNGSVIQINEPVLTTILKPQERVLFFQGRDANPVFHLMESIWLLAGRRDVAFLQQFNSKIGAYSDDGEVFNAAYGDRMRSHFGQDQLFEAISILKNDPTSRQCVIQLWDPADLTKKTLDRCCNMQLVLSIKNEALDILIINRSNDAVWGYAGANAVHFSFLQEFISWAVGVRIGKYYTVSNNLHIYDKSVYDYSAMIDQPPDPDGYDAYSAGLVTPNPIGWNDDWQGWLRDAEAFCNAPFTYDKSMYSFFTDTAHPMAMVSKVRKDKTSDGVTWADRIEASDWRRATLEWIERRELAKQK